ncbi:hypothetical protein ACU4GR_13510 [Methylobacterium oryzae CBMB20]
MMETPLTDLGALNMAPSRRRPSRISNPRWYVRPGRRDDDDDPPPCPAVAMPRPRTPPSTAALAVCA